MTERAWPTPASHASGNRVVAYSELEREVKFAVPSLVPIEERLQALPSERASFIGITREHNDVLDTAGEELKARDERLRVREIEGRPGVLVTWKGPGRVQAGIRRREEREFHADDREACEAVLSNLGLRPVRSYDKVRASWRLDGTIICLDTLPFGSFVEVEFTPEVPEVDETATLERVIGVLGLESAPRLQASYARLQQEWQSMLNKHARKAAKSKRES